MATVPKSDEVFSNDPQLRVLSSTDNPSHPDLDQLRAQAIQALREYSSPEDAQRLLPIVERIQRRFREEATRLAGTDPQIDESGLLPLSRVVKDHVVEVYQAMGRNKTRAARVLEIDIKTLYNKLKRYGVK
jgi:transcriptional regulator of acetoin/glycerol metabolism